MQNLTDIETGGGGPVVALSWPWAFLFSEHETETPHLQGGIGEAADETRTRDLLRGKIPELEEVPQTRMVPRFSFALSFQFHSRDTQERAGSSGSVVAR